MTSNLKSEILNHKSVVTRYAPSPTGFFHIGAVRTALFSYAFAKKYGGKMILRIEDTDRARSKKEYEEDIIEGLAWLGISYEGPYRQSERGDIYKRHLEKLLKEGSAYESKEEKEAIIRFRNPNKKVRFNDIIRGEIEFDTTELKDFVIARSMESPLFHFVVVVDDHEMGITHVIRGEDHISNTPRQILIQEALGVRQPLYAHLPLVLASDKSKLSKRKPSSGEMVALRDYKKAGYLPQAVINFSALLGWSQEDGKEVFSLKEFVDVFALERVQKGGAQFNIKKFRWLNKEHMKRLETKELLEGLRSYMPEEVKTLSQYGDERLQKSAETLLERIEVFSDLKDLAAEGELGYFFEAPHYETPSRIISKEDGTEGAEKAREYIDYITETLSSIERDVFIKEKIKDFLWDYATAEGRGVVLWPLRYALSGKDKSPDPFTLAEILGKEETIARLRNAREALEMI